jgi:DNA mismatch endonuclease (patch repair protein)
MARIGGKNTAPELIVRRLLHGAGYRFRLHRKDLPGTPDIVLPSRRAAIFVHGCFWHAHGCKIGRAPKSKLDYWLPKLTENKRRDEVKQAALEALEWRVLTVWQCEARNPLGVADILSVFLDGDVSDRHPGVDVLKSPQHTDAIRP